MTTYTTNCTKVGNEFEELVIDDLINKGFTLVGKKVRLPDTYSEADIVAIKNGTLYFVEAKGGKPGGKRLPGAQRSDNVRKAQSNAYMIKRKYTEEKMIVYFSAEPKSQCPKGLIEISLKDKLFDEVCYLSYES